MSYDSWSWGAISAGSAARGRQCYLLQLGTDPVRTGRFRVAWLDEDGEVLAWWTGEAEKITGGWEGDRFLVLTDRDEADHQLYRARHSYGGRDERRVEIVEMTA